MCKYTTRGRGRKKGVLVSYPGDPRDLRFRERNGRNRSRKRQDGTYAIQRGQKAQPAAQV